MLDTNLCIRLLRDRPKGLRHRFDREVDTLRISTVILYELLVGAEKSTRPDHNRHEVEDLAERIGILPFDEAAADHAARMRVSLERAGMGIGSNDLLTAGHARSRGLTVVTGNLGEFRRVEGLRCEDWLEPQA